ncbi:MAG TPA: MBL fold metallo-hydrolase, partial [Verrucomicrobiae bacterium]|nr:MBL fold metallo-hydrolase [Verrucomicrobiae bacterium]
ARFERIDLPSPSPFTGVLVDDPLFRIEAVHLDHKIPCLAFALAEVQRINIDPERLKRLGFSAGPWLTEFKRLVRAGASDDTVVRAPCGDETGETFQELLLGDLRDKIVTITNGQRLVYVTDTLYSDENRQKIVALAHDADILFCEAMYLEQDRDRATERHHLTARQAGLLAREANVKELVIFHFSQRYQECQEALYYEAAEAFGGPVRSR